MGYSVKILADSVSDAGHRLTTMEVTYPRIIHAEMLTHRAFSRNSASSRAIPVEKMIQRVKDNPFVPTYWGANQKGMQAHEEITPAEQEAARWAWLNARDKAVDSAYYLSDTVGVHKQLVNRLLEPFQWHTVIVSATEWDNFFALRCHPDAQPEIQEIAYLMNVAINASTPTLLHAHEWHTPLLPDEDNLLKVYHHSDLLKVSAARCARVSYLTHDGERDPEKDLGLYARLVDRTPRHSSPLEHIARPGRGDRNFRGWVQLREIIEDPDQMNPLGVDILG